MITLLNVAISCRLITLDIVKNHAQIVSVFFQITIILIINIEGHMDVPLSNRMMILINNQT